MSHYQPAHIKDIAFAIGELVRRGQITTWSQIADRFNQREMIDITGLGVRVVRRLSKDWSKADGFERARLRAAFDLTAGELERLLEK